MTPSISADLIDTALIRNEMKLRCWTQRNLAKASGLDPDTISVVLRGANAEPLTLRKIAKAFADNAPDPFIARMLAARGS